MTEERARHHAMAGNTGGCVSGPIGPAWSSSKPFSTRSAHDPSAHENQLADFKGNRVRSAWTKMPSALPETISSGEKPRWRAKMNITPIKTPVIRKFGHALSAH